MRSYRKFAALAEAERAPEVSKSPSADPMAANLGLSSLPEIGKKQIDGLIQQVFLTDAHQRVITVVFADLERTACGVAFSRQVAEQLAELTSERVCLVADPGEKPRSTRLTVSSENEQTRELGATRLHRNLWLLPIAELLDPVEPPQGRERIRDWSSCLHSDFAYVVIHAPPLAQDHAAERLARHADGVILLLQANGTRRQAAAAARARLNAAGVSLLGTVLLDRKFPIPAALYQRL